MPNKGFAAANDGNISFRLSDDRVLCTPTRVSLPRLLLTRLRNPWVALTTACSSVGTRMGFTRRVGSINCAPADHASDSASGAISTIFRPPLSDAPPMTTAAIASSSARCSGIGSRGNARLRCL